MNHCPVTTDLNSHLARQERDEATSEHVASKVEELMEDHAEVASALDEMMADSDTDGKGNSLFANDLAAVLMASSAAFGGEAIRYFVKLREQVRAQVLPVAETLAAEEVAQSGQDHAEQQADLREAAQAWGDDHE